jgi:crotonobetainyl-CoA:carnitine CoA-transferase CaiB-like acyl-CoA transferase
MASGLEGIRVVEAASAVAVPMVGRLLCDWGAEVIHIDHTVRTMGQGQGQGAAQSSERQIQSDFNYLGQNTGCNKRSMALDLSKEGGRDIIYRLIKSSDVFLSNFRPRELEKFKLEYATLTQMNPHLVCGTLTGFGRKGPDRNEPGFGPTAGDSRSGLLHVLMAPGTDPVQMPIAYADFITGLTLAYGIMTALLIRERTGVAQEVDASLYNSVVWALTSDIAGTLVTGKDRQATARKDRGTPLMNAYRTKDNRWVSLMMTRRDAFWEKFSVALGRDELASDPRFAGRQMSPESNSALFSILEETFLTRTLEEWRPRLNGVGFPWAPVQSLPEVVKDPQAIANGFFMPLNHPTRGPIEIVANPAKLSKTAECQKRPAPEFNEHTEQILLEMGFTQDDVKRLREQQVII